VNRTQESQAPIRAAATFQRPAATIRPPESADLAPLTVFFAGLSIGTRVLRFFAPVRPTAALVRLACGFAGRAGGETRTGRTFGTDALIAVHGGDIIGHAMAVDRPAEAAAGRPVPPAGPVTEIGVVVADAWQGRGVGSDLVRALISRAQARGVTSLSMDVLPANQRVLAIIAAHWPGVRTRRSADCVTVQVALPRPSSPARRPITRTPITRTRTPRGPAGVTPGVSSPTGLGPASRAACVGPVPAAPLRARTPPGRPGGQRRGDVSGREAQFP
jgi:GNAT superfamily N-acetyltransferase